MREVVIIEKAEFEGLLEHLEKLSARVSRLEQGLSEYVRTKEALRILGVSRSTLELERDRPGTVIVYKKVGRSVSYLRSSLESYNEQKRIRRR